MMETELLDKTAVKAKFRITVPSDEVDRAFGSALTSLSRQVRVPGFRPGKAPRGVLLRRLGDDTLKQEVREALINENYPIAIEKLSLMAIHASFETESPIEGEAYVFEVSVDLYPELTLPNLTEITIDSASRTVTDEDTKSATAQLANHNATLVPVDRAITPKDYVLVEPLSSDGESSPLPIDLDQAGDELVQQLVGKEQGTEIDLAFAATSENAEPTSLKVKIIDVKEKELPELDDDFARTLGLETWDEATSRIRENLQAQLNNETFQTQREEFVEKLLEKTDFEIPDSLLNRRKVRLLEEIAQDLSRRNLTIDDYLASLEKDGTRSEFDENLSKRVELEVRRDLVLEKVHEVLGADVKDEDFDRALESLATREGKDLVRFRRDQGEAWLTNYRFLMSRDQTLSNLVQEKVSAKSSIIVE
jgi:trigger factor